MNNPTKCIVYRNNAECEVHTFIIVGDNTQYDQIRSMMEFIHRENDVRIKAKLDMVRIPINAEIVFSEKWYLYPYLHSIVSIHHASIWDMYIAINYDITTKKYK